MLRQNGADGQGARIPPQLFTEASHIARECALGLLWLFWLQVPCWWRGRGLPWGGLEGLHYKCWGESISLEDLLQVV